MTFDELKDKARSLPLVPGVYIMRDKSDKVIYVGKAKKLKNRVSQYFQDTASHTPKTRMMVSKIHHFDVIVANQVHNVLNSFAHNRIPPNFRFLTVLYPSDFRKSIFSSKTVAPHGEIHYNAK